MIAESRLASAGQRHRATLRYARRFLREEAATASQDRLLSAALVDLQGGPGAGSSPVVPVELPLLVHAACAGTVGPALPIAAAGLLLYVGFDVLDALMDGDALPPAWRRHSEAEVLLAGATLVAVAPRLLVARASLEPRTAAALEQRLARGLLEISAGQQADLSHRDARKATPTAVLAVVVAKSGGMLGLLAALAAMAAGAPEAAVAEFDRMGRALGTAGQLHSDCADLLSEDEGKDLASGIVTLPVAFRVQELEGRARARFVRLLRRARTDPGARSEVRADVIREGALLSCGPVIEFHRLTALDALGRVGLPPEVAGPLRNLIGLLA